MDKINPWKNTNVILPFIRAKMEMFRQRVKEAGIRGGKRQGDHGSKLGSKQQFKVNAFGSRHKSEPLSNGDGEKSVIRSSSKRGEAKV